MPIGQPVHRLSDVNGTSRTAVCAACGPVTIIARRRGDREGWRCRTAAVANRHPNHLRNAAKYQITGAEWTAMLIAQSGRCAICLDPMTSPNTDHDHQTGQVRGLLCQGCNLGLGFFQDDPERLRRAALYL